MQTFIDTDTAQLWSFEDDVMVVPVTRVEGEPDNLVETHYNLFYAPHDQLHPMDVPASLIPLPEGWEPPAPPLPAREEVWALRQAAYRAESDPLKVEADFDAYEYGVDPDYTDWASKVREIKERYPLPE